MSIQVTYVAAGDAEYTTDPNAVLATRNIGSCVSVAALDPHKKVGGLLHTLLPDARIDPFSADSLSFNPYKYIPTGIPLFLRHIFDMGAQHESLRIFVFGGFTLISRDEKMKLGERNIVALRRTLWQEGVLIHQQELGDQGFLRRVRLNMGEHTVNTFHRKKGRTTYEN